jgi:hypothetical protein
MENNPPPTILPHRLTESSFRRFEPTIAHIINNYPSVVELCPMERIARTTYIARLRDAMLSFNRYKWPSGVISYIIFERVYSSIVISARDDGKILAGERTQVARFGDIENAIFGVNVSNPSNHSTDPFDFGVVTLSELQLICKLSASRLITRPIKLKSFDGDITITNLRMLENLHDVVIEYQQDGSFVVY